MSANTWSLAGKTAYSLSLLSLLFFQGCSNKHQLYQDGSRFTYYSTGKSSKTKDYKNSNSSHKASSSKNFKYTRVGGKVSKGQGSAAIHRATLRPYTTFGIRYFPKIAEIGSESFGIASWYGPKFHGKQTSCGETYDMHGMTAAHKTLPMHSIVDVTHRKSGKTIRVRINDRGPFVEGRIIDLSFTAGRALGLDKTGTAPVKVKVISYDEYISGYAKRKDNNGDIGYGVQLASFSVKQSAENLKNEASIKYSKDVKIKTVQRGSEIIYKVIITGFNSENKAKNFKNRFGLRSAVVVAD
ncbi:MAG: septal ring lytic transglycosylase RlpA family protein [Campylobacterales bacterium]|nr:septal ring lytic transglycosylase RlpA family protein [Campylobacterales bacterium]